MKVVPASSDIIGNSHVVINNINADTRNLEYDGILNFFPNFNVSNLVSFSNYSLRQNYIWRVLAEKIESNLPPDIGQDTIYYFRLFGIPESFVHLYQTPDANLASTNHVDLNTWPVVIDGTQVTFGATVLLKNQNDATKNGLYISPYYQGAPWTRHPQAIYRTQIKKGSIVKITSGATNADKIFVLLQDMNLDGDFNTTSLSFVELTARIFGTKTNALNNVSPLGSNFYGSFKIDKIEKTYDGIECREYASQNISNIACCPEPAELYFPPDTATLTFPNGSSIGNSLILKRASTEFDNYGNKKFGAKTEFGGFSHHADITVNDFNVYYYLSFRHGWYSSNDYNLVTSSGNRPNRNGSYISFGANGVPHLTERVFLGTNLISNCIYVGDQNVNTATTPILLTRKTYQQMPSMFWYGSILQQDTMTLNFSGITQMPEAARLYMPDSYFYDSERIITIGEIDDVLTWDFVTGMYLGPVHNYYNIPGRLHVSTNFFPTVSSGIKYIHNDSISGGTFNSFPDETIEHATMFLANDFYNGYQTGLPQGSLWFDVKPNFASNINISNVELSGKPLINVRYSQWKNALYFKNANNNSFYTANSYSVRSDSDQCFFSSLR